MNNNSIPTTNPSYDNHVYDDDDDQEKEFEENLDEISTIQQIQNEMNILPAAAVVSPQISIQPKRLVFFSKISFFHKSKESKKREVRRLKLFELYRFADKKDIFLMIIGTIAAITAGALISLMLVLYRKVANSLIDFGKLQANATVLSAIVTNLGECFILPNNSSETESPSDVIHRLIKYYLVLGFVSILLYWIAWTTWMTAAERQVQRIRYALFRNILRQEIGWFDKRNANELINHLADDLDKFKDGINDKVPDVLSLLARSLSMLVYALLTGWKLTLVFLSTLPLILIIFNATIKVIVKYTAKEIQAFASASAIAQEVLQNIRTVTAFQGQAQEEERFAKHLNTAKKIGLKKGLYLGLCQGMSEIFIFLAFTLTFWYGPLLVRTDCAHYSGGSVVVVFIACMVITLGSTQIIPSFQSFAEALASGSFVFDIIDRKTMIDATSNEGEKPQVITGDIQFDNVTFAYPTRQEVSVLKNISLKIPSGRTVALVGASGCGKSTIIQLIQRFYDPEQGRVLLDGKDIKTLNVAWLRSHIGIVSQEPVLFTGSIEENIRLGKEDATDDEVQNAAKMANAHDFIMALPENYKTSSGDKLSGGQKQRVAIARALISNPKLLLLDEATSALDTTNERTVQDALDKVKEGRTTIVIAHRLSTIRNVNLIIVLDRGEIVEHGTHDYLMQEKGLYYQLVTAETEKEKEREDDFESTQEEEFARQISRNHSFSKQSVESMDEQASSMDLSKKKKKEFQTSFLFEIMKLNAPEWPRILLGAICSLIYGATMPIFALLFSYVYGLFAKPDLDEQKHLTNIYAGAIFIVGFVGGVAVFLSTVGFAKSGEELTVRTRKLTFSAMLRQEMAYFDQEANSVGALSTRLSSDASSLKGMTGVRIGIILQALSAGVTALVIAFEAEWKLAFVLICFIPLMIFSGKIQGQKQGKAGQVKDKDSFIELGGQHAAQALEHIRTVVGLHQEKHFIDLYENTFNQEFKKQIRHLHLTGLGAGLANSLMYFLHCTNFVYGSKLVENREITYDKVLRVATAITFAMLAVGRSMAMVPDFSKAKNAAIRIMTLNKRQSQINPHNKLGIILTDVIGNIEFNDIDFQYPSRPTLPVLKDFSLKCSNSATTALVGPSGSGKSTTIALLQRFYDPSKGRVLLDGHDIRVLNIQWLRSLIGFVQQEPVLFNISIRDNIAYGDNSRQVTQNEIETAAQMANVHEFIISLPKGYETLCGTKGSQLSGGQKQRIAIARALVRCPKILLLDEATSALDTKSEKVIQAALGKARSGRTCLTIAHRLSTIQNSQKIAVVDRGRMKEEGAYDELVALNGIYAKLVLAQERSS